MNRPWKIWSAYFMTLLIMITAMVWLSAKVLEVDRRETFARQQADFEEQVSIALWRMDSTLTPIIAREVARPYSAFHSFNRVRNNDIILNVASPLLRQDSEYVFLHFELRANNKLTSPQMPNKKLLSLAIDNGITAKEIQLAKNRLQQLQEKITHDQLASLLPKSQSGNLDQITETQVFDSYNQNPNITAPNPQSQTANLPNQAEYKFRQGNFAKNAVAQAKQQRDQVQMMKSIDIKKIEIESIFHPIWLGDNLFLARRAVVDGQAVIQGSWLNWPKLKIELTKQVEELLPEVNLVPLESDAEANPQRVLATLPVKLEIPPLNYIAAVNSPIQTSLWIAWICMVCVAIALAVMLFSVISLSERRGAFVSSVTHELRTPLTTFRMYTEMLEGGMVKDENQQRKYLETLRVEADRLSHLVENVLSYAQLERGNNKVRRSKINFPTMINRSLMRLQDRCEQAKMSLHVADLDMINEIQVNTDPTVIEQILFNLVDNSCKYAQAAEDKRIHLDFEISQDSVTILVKDHGPGVAAEVSGKLFRPFSKTSQQAANSAAGVGLGLALCRRQVRQLKGELSLIISSESGTTFAIKIPRN